MTLVKHLSAIDLSGAELMTGTAGRIPLASLRLWVAVIAALVILDATGYSWVVRAAPARNPLDVELRDAGGRRLRLGEFKGRVVLVDLWASWCAECQRQFPVLDRLSREYRPRGVEIVAVNLDQHKEDADAFLAMRPHEMLVVFDPRARMLEAFGAAGIPSSYLIDRQGTVRYQHSGFTPGTEAQYRQQLDFLLAEPAR